MAQKRLKLSEPMLQSKSLLLQNFDEKSCADIIRNSLLGLRRLPLKVDGVFGKKKIFHKLNHKNSHFKHFLHLNYLSKRFNKLKKCRPCSINHNKLLKEKKLKSYAPLGEENKEYGMKSKEDIDNKNYHNFLINKVHKSSLELPSTNGRKHYIGQVVWARLSFCSTWPAIVIDGSMCGQNKAQEDKCWVFWFGDHNVSEVPKINIFDFRDYFHQYYNEKNNKKSYETGVYQALELYYTRKGLTNKNFDDSTVKVEKLHEIDHQTDVSIPQWILLIMKNYRSGNNFKDLQKNKIENDINVDLKTNDEKFIKKIEKKEHLNIKNEVANSSSKQIREDLCMACRLLEGPHNHPFICGKLCTTCKERLISSIFLFDMDGYNLYCVICSQKDEVFLCDNTGCNKVFCNRCLTDFFGKSHVQMIRSRETWICFLCDRSSWSLIGCHGVIDNWKEELNLMFQPEPVITPGTRKRMRVLSLFDGISTGKVVLDQLHVDVEVYYASEIDADSLLVSKGRHGGEGGVVQWVGDVTNISSQMLEEMSPIDLLIGGSPCNEFSIANPGRKGLSEEGTGVLFYEFYRILKELQALQTPGRPVFWLFENVASMQKQCRATMTRFFKCHPAMLDAKYFSAQRRSRLFWGNIPLMYCPPQYNKVLISKFLNENLFPGRQSQGSNSEKPVTFQETNEESLLWMPELERVFGFPDHYTDVGDLPRGRRQKLIGQAWSVHVVKHILAPLTDFYKLKVDS